MEGSAREMAAAQRRRAKRGFVRFVTNDKTIQATLTGAAFGIISKASEGNAAIISWVLGQFSGIYIPQQFITAGFLVGVFAVAYWADRHTDEWRDLIAEKTGEDDAVEEEAAQDEESE